MGDKTYVEQVPILDDQTCTAHPFGKPTTIRNRSLPNRHMPVQAVQDWTSNRGEMNNVAVKDYDVR